MRKLITILTIAILFSACGKTPQHDLEKEDSMQTLNLDIKTISDSDVKTLWVLAGGEGEFNDDEKENFKHSLLTGLDWEVAGFAMDYYTMAKMTDKLREMEYSLDEPQPAVEDSTEYKSNN